MTNKFQAIIYSAIMDARFTKKNMLEVLDETCDWLNDEFVILDCEHTSKENILKIKKIKKLIEEKKNGKM